MFIWWHRIWNRDSQRQQTFVTNAYQRSADHQTDSCHAIAATPATTHHHHQLPYSVHHNCKSQTKCMSNIRTDHTSRMHSFCTAIILIHCLNVLVLALASENLGTQSQPCNRSRRVFTDMQGEIANGPPGYNYTQVRSFIALTFAPFFFHPSRERCIYIYQTFRHGWYELNDKLICIKPINLICE